MQEVPLISVMIITYNHEKYVRQAVEGALMQQCSYPFEIVLCDDFSTDHTREVCKKLQKENPQKIRLILNDYNKGVIDNYIETMRQCKGKYIADCAGDDYWIDPLKLQKQVDILEKQEDVVLVYTNWKDLITETGQLLDDSKSRKNNFKKESLTSDDFPVYLNQKGHSIVNINTSCFRRETALKVVGKYSRFFDVEKYPCEDFQLLFLMLACGSFYYLDDETGVYRNNYNSVSRSTDYSKYFVHQYKKTNLRIALAREFDININAYLDKQSFLLMYLAFKARNGKYSEMAEKILADYGYRIKGKTKTLHKITVNGFLLMPLNTLFLISKTIKQFLIR